MVAMFGPAAAGAQEAPSFTPRQVTLGGGIVWSGPYDVGDATAGLRGNGIGSAPPVFTLFTASSRITQAFAPELRVGYAVTPQATIEFGLAYTRPRVAISIRNDAEAPSQDLPGETLEQYVIGGAVTWQLPVRVGRQWAPFAIGGAAWLRQLHQDRTLAENGQLYYAGGGARYFLRGGHGPGRAIGLRGDARVNFRTNGVDFEDQMRMYPTVSVAAFIGF
jgi:hypothetical protein